MARLNLLAYNEMFIIRIADVAPKRLQLLSLTLLFLCTLGKDTMVPSLEWLFSQLVSSMKEPEELISTNRAAHP